MQWPSGRARILRVDRSEATGKSLAHFGERWMSFANGCPFRSPGDQRAIAVETCRRLNMGTHVLGEEAWSGEADLATKVGGFGKLVESVNGFASVSPEHKFLVREDFSGD